MREPTPELLAERYGLVLKALARLLDASYRDHVVSDDEGDTWRAIAADGREALDGLRKHIETLTAGIDVAMKDRQALAERVDAIEAALAAERGRREAAESDLAQMTLARDELAAKLAQVMAALGAAVEAMVDMRSYVPLHFAEKWGHDAAIVAARCAWEALLPKPEKPGLTGDEPCDICGEPLASVVHNAPFGLDGHHVGGKAGTIWYGKKPEKP